MDLVNRVVMTITEQTMKLPNTELKTAVAIEVCISEVFEGVYPCSGVVSTALAKLTADDTGGGIQDMDSQPEGEGWIRGRPHIMPDQHLMLTPPTMTCPLLPA